MKKFLFLNYFLLPGDDCGSCCGTRTPPVFQAFGSRSNSSNRCGGADRENSSSSCDSCEEDEKPNKRTVHQVTIFNIDSLTAVFSSALISVAKLAFAPRNFASFSTFDSLAVLLVIDSFKLQKVVEVISFSRSELFKRIDIQNVTVIVLEIDTNTIECKNKKHKNISF